MKNEIREFIKENGRVAARKKYGDAIDNIHIDFDGNPNAKGLVFRYWHPEFTCYVWKAQLTLNGNVHEFIDFVSSGPCVEWVKNKYNALQLGSFGSWLRYAQLESTLSVDSLAEQIQCSRYVIFKWMRTESYPPAHMLVKLARALKPFEVDATILKWTKQIELERK